MTEQMHTPLKPCPFCGGKAVLRETIEHYPADEDGPAGDVSCRFEVDCDECGISRSEECRDDAVADWNRRSDAASSQERIAQLEAQVAEAVKVIEPFAEAADDLDDKHADRSEIWEAPAAMSITAGHLRAARAMLAAAPERIVGAAK